MASLPRAPPVPTQQSVSETTPKTDAPRPGRPAKGSDEAKRMMEKVRSAQVQRGLSNQ